MEDRIEETGGRLLKPEVVGKLIADQIVSCRGGQLIIPKSSSRLAGMRSWTNWLQEFARDRSFRKADVLFSHSTK